MGGDSVGVVPVSTSRKVASTARRFVLCGALLVLATIVCAWATVLCLTEPQHSVVGTQSGVQYATLAPAGTSQDVRDGPTLQHVVLHTDVELDTDRLETIVKRTCEEVRSLTGLPVPQRRLPIYLCTDLRQVREIAQRHGVRPLETVGAFYPKVPMAIVRENSRKAQTVSHEVVHWIIAHSVLKCPPLIDEGVAVLVSERVIVRTLAEEFGRKPSSLKLRSQRGRHRRLRAFLDRPGQHRLERLLRLTYQGFKNLGEDGQLFYDLGWCLAKVLEERGGELGGSMRILFRQLCSKRDHLEVIKSLYSIEALEQVWMTTISEVAQAR